MICKMYVYFFLNFLSGSIVIAVSFVSQVADITMLASWYCEPDNCDRPVIVIIDDLERCNGETLAEFTALLRYSTIFMCCHLIFGQVGLKLVESEFRDVMS